MEKQKIAQVASKYGSLNNRWQNSSLWDTYASAKYYCIMSRLNILFVTPVNLGYQVTEKDGCARSV